MALYEVVSNQPSPNSYGGNYRNGSIVGFQNQQWEVSKWGNAVTLKRVDKVTNQIVELPIIPSALLKVHRY